MQFPDKSLFGTICILDSKENAYDNKIKELIISFKELFEDNLKLLLTQKELNSQSQLIDKLLNHTPALIFIKDLTHKYLMANERFFSVFDLNKDDVIGKSDLEIFPKDIAESFMKNDLLVIGSGSEQIIEEKALQIDGYHYSIVTKFPLKGESGETIGVCGICIDITDKKKSEIELEENRKRLGELVSDLKASNDALENFAFVASHDLQEPLRKVLAFGKMLQENSFDKMDDRGKDCLTRMIKGANNMRLFLNDLLIYSKVTAEKKIPAPVDLNQILEDVKESLSLRIEKTGGKIISDHLPEVKGSKFQLYQLFQNLLSNCLKFHKEDCPPEIRINTYQENSRQVIVVKDNGIGFEEKYLLKVFKPFERLHGHSKYEGSGLGLSICKKVVDNHKGNIDISSEKDIGTTVTVQLPV